MALNADPQAQTGTPLSLLPSTAPAANLVAVDLASLSAQQLSSVKKQLDDELEHLTTSFSKLRAAQVKFEDCVKSIKDVVSSRTDGQSTYRMALDNPWWISQC